MVLVGTNLLLLYLFLQINDDDDNVNLHLRDSRQKDNRLSFCVFVSYVEFDTQARNIRVLRVQCCII